MKNSRMQWEGAKSISLSKDSTKKIELLRLNGQVNDSNLPEESKATIRSLINAICNKGESIMGNEDKKTYKDIVEQLPSFGGKDMHSISISTSDGQSGQVNSHYINNKNNTYMIRYNKAHETWDFVVVENWDGRVNDLIDEVRCDVSDKEIKQSPKRDGKWSFCPRCKEGVGFRESALVSAFEYSIDFQPFYCPNCGQRIDWM